VCPENTLPAFAAAVAVGVHEIEIDLRLSRDGVPVVCHDPDVERTTNGKGLITEMDWGEISELDAGITFSEEWAGIHMPRFEEVLSLAGGRTSLNIHIKDGGPDGKLIKMVCDSLREQGMENTGTYIGIESEDEFDFMHTFGEGIPCAYLAHQGDLEVQIETALKHKCERIQLNKRYIGLDQLEPIQETDFIYNLFWSDDYDEALEFAEKGIDVILTNCAHTFIDRGFPNVSEPSKDTDSAEMQDSKV
jgi:glycerophosphoryl diester phosphodiesterase